MQIGKDYQRKAEAKYDIVYQDMRYYEVSCGLDHAPHVAAAIKFKSVLDVGCGPAYALTYFLKEGKEVMGVEVCKYLYENMLRPFVVNNLIVPGRIQELPFEAESYDLVYCTEVLEHIPEPDCALAVSELVRVAKKYVYLTVATVPAMFRPDLGLHETVKPKGWWDNIINRYRLKEVTSLKAREAQHGFAKLYKKY